ncbi:hypothetical protein GGTG_10102 [Gaeumannomyces tritici R3-111a-1]|uniref:Alternative oxidase n=1 Tax=Gaeumannomyces tritici (strain R3-111a-1) TaxID=644352 RepID=J3P9B9_GAET3|nr:hypothetical protein GGTG_10102 [Gaeumannomyces tritici R3-111a-1]EJT73255.1 hypothetical protein GGTG_10102 [Gaeumannomyces tritici R3-111a-1]
MLAQANLISAAKFAVPLVIFVWTFVYMTSSSPRATYGQVMRKFKDQRTLFVSDFLENEIDGPFDGKPIEAMCASKTWNRDWILQCDAVPEGVGTVRNGHLQCIRLAIELGASGLILPEIIQRSEHDIAKAVPNSKGPVRGVSLDYFFDKEHLTTSLGRLCPQMKLYSSINDLANVPSVLNGIKLEIPKAFASKAVVPISLVHGTVVADVQKLSQAVRAHIKSKDDAKLRPLKMQLPWAAFWYPVASDPPEFVASFGRLLRVRADARRLAAETLFALRASYGLDLDPRRARPSGSGPETGGALTKSFMGVRLRTDRDIQVKSPPWPSYVDQAPHFLGLMAERKAPVMYLAQGASAANETSLKARGEDLGATVVTKWDLLEGAGLQAEVQALHALSWDQQSLVDYEVMLRAGLVAGIAHSSFAWNLAARRRVAYGVAHKALGINASRAETLQLPKGNVQYQDSHTVIFRAGTGMTAPKNAEAMELTIWP